MDLYLEYPAFWSLFDTRLMVAIADAITPQLGSQYYVEVESRTYQSDEADEELLIGIPDAIVFAGRADTTLTEFPTTETTSLTTQFRPEKVFVPMPIEVKQRYLEVREMTTDTVITVVELLSPPNKRSGEGRTAYEKKRQLILGSATHLVEKPIVSFQDIFSDLYDRARYATRIDYRQPTPPPVLSEMDQQGVEALLTPLQDA